MTSRKFDDFDPFAEQYREIHNRNIRVSGADSYYFAAMKAEIISKREKAEVASFLDIGCGDGACEIFLGSAKPGWQLTGTDISSSSIQVARSRDISNAEFLLTEGTALPFRDHSFDIVFMAGVLHHIASEEQQEILAEAYRVLKKGGRFYLFEHNPLNPLTRYLVKTCIFDKDARLISATHSRSLLVNAGFKNLVRNFIIFLPRWRWLRWILPLELLLEKVPLGGQYYFICEKS